jgi:hypothetical protein
MLSLRLSPARPPTHPSLCVRVMHARARAYFLQVRPPSECAADDGTCIGHMLVDAAEAAKKPDRAAAIRTFVMRTAMLRECGFATLDAMLIAIYSHSNRRKVAKGLGLIRFRAVFAQAVATHDPTALTAAEAETIGNGLESILRLSATHIEAVDELLRKYPALAVTAQQHVWFRPMLEAIAKRRMASAPFGLKLRLGIGAGLSMADMVSDVVSIVGMLQSGLATYAYVMIGLIGTPTLTHAHTHPRARARARIHTHTHPLAHACRRARERTHRYDPGCSAPSFHHPNETPWSARRGEGSRLRAVAHQARRRCETLGFRRGAHRGCSDGYDHRIDDGEVRRNCVRVWTWGGSPGVHRRERALEHIGGSVDRHLVLQCWLLDRHDGVRL